VGSCREAGICKPRIRITNCDDDPKGFDIPKAALADIREWSDAEFEFVRVGLNEGDGKRLGIPANPEDPGHYQWEALGDDQAGEMITEAVSRYYSKEALAVIKAEQAEITAKFHDRFGEFIDAWE